MRSVILHVGMHKTGSTSIQKSFQGSAGGPLAYFQNESGHSNHAKTLFSIAGSLGSDRPRQRAAAAPGRGSVNAPGPEEGELLGAYMGRLGSQSLLLSTEGAVFLSVEELERVLAFFARHGSVVSVYAYVRSPAAYMTSMFQQRVKGGSVRGFELETDYPDYRGTFEKFDRVFGRDRVHLRKFDPAAFPDGCVVRDFSTWIGHPLPSERIVRVNESLSREATGLLYAFRRHGRKPVNEQGRIDAKVNSRLLATLAGVGASRLQLAADLLKPILDTHRDDIAWMEQRLGGVSLAEALPSGGTTVRDEADLYAAARAAVPLLGDKVAPQRRAEAGDLSPEALAGIVAALAGAAPGDQAPARAVQRPERAERPARSEAPVAERLRPAAIVADLLARDDAAALQGVSAEQATAILRGAFAAIRAAATAAGGSVEVPGLGRCSAEAEAGARGGRGPNARAREAQRGAPRPGRADRPAARRGAAVRKDATD